MNNKRNEDIPGRRSIDYVASSPRISEKSRITAEDIKKQLNVLVIMTVLLYVGVAVLLWWVWDQSNSNTHSLCAIRHDFQVQVIEGQDFLKIHPHGAFGLTTAQLQQSINTSSELVSALKNVNC